MAMTLEQTQQNFPLDLSGLDTLIDPEDYDKEIHNAIRNQLQQGGLISPTKNITNFQVDPEDTPGFLESLGQKIFNMSPEVYDSTNPEAVGNYMEERFEFITGHEDYREKVYRDSRKRRKIGYGFNLDEPTNRDLFKKALKKTDKDFDALRDGTAAVDPTQARILFEASAGEAERLITNKFGALNLKGFQRMALVSLAYNHPNLIGPKLTEALSKGDLKAVDHEIRNRSNLYKIKGIASRRALEADMFAGMGNDSGWSLAKIFGAKQAQASEPQKVDEIPEDRNERGLIDEIKHRANQIVVSNIPSNARVAVQDVLGINFDEIQRDDYFSDEQIVLLQSMVKKKMDRGHKKSGGWQNKDYTNPTLGVEWAGDIGKFTPEYVIKTTLGQFTYHVKDNGDVIVTDQFNYNDANKLQKQNPTTASKIRNLYQYSMSDEAGEYGIMRRFGALFGSGEGEGIKFEINIGNIKDFA